MPWSSVEQPDDSVTFDLAQGTAVLQARDVPVLDYGSIRRPMMTARINGPGTRAALAALLAVSALILHEAQFGAVALAQGPDQQDAVEVFNRDVFVIVGSTLRNPDATTLDSAPLFNVAGVSLNLTWGMWKRAGAQSTAHAVGGPNNPRTDLRISLSGLVPGGVYSIFYGTLTPDSENPLCPGVERTLALISTDRRQMPDASSFVADAAGRAEFRGEISGRPLDVLQFFYTVIYHFDGMTYGALPNRGEFLTQGSMCRSSFGEDAMRQLVVYQKFQ
jgi:hypothetical protein